MNQEPIKLETRQLCVGYRRKAVVSGVEFCVRAGEILALVGPNGAGKSTLMKSIAGQLALQGGTVLLSGKNMVQQSPNETARELSLLLTGQTIPELMTCREVVAAGRYPYTGRLGILSQEDWDRVDAAMERLRAEALAERPFDAVSDGQRQRVLLARALCQEPKVWSWTNQLPIWIFDISWSWWRHCGHWPGRKIWQWWSVFTNWSWCADVRIECSA